MGRKYHHRWGNRTKTNLQHVNQRCFQLVLIMAVTKLCVHVAWHAHSNSHLLNKPSHKLFYIGHHIYPPKHSDCIQIYWAHPLCNKENYITATTTPGNISMPLSESECSFPFRAVRGNMERHLLQHFFPPQCQRADSHQVPAGWLHSERWICFLSLPQRFDLWKLDLHSLLPPKGKHVLNTLWKH